MTKLTDLLACITLFLSLWLGVVFEYSPLEINENNKLLVYTVGYAFTCYLVKSRNSSYLRLIFFFFSKIKLPLILVGLFGVRSFGYAQVKLLR
jgi:hypothetical protein